MQEVVNIKKSKIYYKSYYQRNKDDIKKRNNAYYYKNKAVLKENKKDRSAYNKQYTIDNRTKKHTYYQEYYKTHKDEIIKRQSEKIGCRTCHCMVGINYFKKHISSTKHKRYLNMKIPKYNPPDNTKFIQINEEICWNIHTEDGWHLSANIFDPIENLLNK
jgi:hypothetical protein|tara:strand:+ start:256 stop:738 length:483 start_codon:yes stop_codon:yes gene_type:complete